MATSQLQHLEFAQQLHACLIKKCRDSQATNDVTFELMGEEYGIQPSAEHYACVIDMLGRFGRLDGAHNFSKQLGVEGNVLGIWGSLLAACRVHRNFVLGKIVSSKLLELEGSDGISGYHVLLSNIYAEEGNWQSVDNVRRGMRKMGLSKEVGCSWIDTSGYPHCFVSKDKKHPQYCMIYDMLGYLTINMKDAGYKPKLELMEEWIYGLEE